MAQPMILPAGHPELIATELRVDQLRKKIALRESQQDLPTAGSTFGRDPAKHIEPLRVELRNAAAVLIGMKWDPLEVLKRMSEPPPAAPAPSPPPPPQKPTADEVRAQLREILSHVPDNATVASVRELFK